MRTVIVNSTKVVDSKCILIKSFENFTMQYGNLFNVTV